MIGTMLMATLFTSAVNCTVPGFTSDTLKAKWDAGVSFGEFLAAADDRRDQWVSNYASGAAVDATLVARAAALTGNWRLLVVAIDSCSDSVNTVPWIARLVDQLPAVEMRVIDPEIGRSIMEAHRTPDGRAATPTVLLLDEQWQVRGCFIERPRSLRAHLDSLPDARRFTGKMSWYEQDAGRETVREVVAMIESAAAGDVRCD